MSELVSDIISFTTLVTWSTIQKIQLLEAIL